MKKFVTVAEIANLMNYRNTIDIHEKEFKEMFKNDKFLVMADHEECEEARQKIAWIFDLDVDILVKARKLMNGDNSINGKEKVYL